MPTIPRLLRGWWITALLSFGTQALAQAPTITSVSPLTGPEKRNVTINGNNFLTSVTSRTVRLNGAIVNPFSVGNTRLIFTIPAGATSGPISVTTNFGAVTTPDSFIVGPGPAPANDHFAAAQILPATSSGSILANTANATKEVGEPNHAGFPGGASVWFSWTAPSTGQFLFNPHDTTVTNFGVNLAVYTGTSVDALTPIVSASAQATISRFQSAVVLNATAGVTYFIAIDATNGIMGDFRLSWSPLAPLTIASFTPTSGHSGQAFVITGTGFVPGAQVIVGGATASSTRTTVNSSTSISVTQVPAAAAYGPAPLTVVTSVGTVSSATNFTVLPPPPPNITSFTPTNGSVNTQVSITGTGLYLGDGTSVSIRFNGLAANPVTIISSTSLSARVPSGATTGPITVQTPAGTATSSTNFTVTGSFIPPVILGVFPSSGAPGTSVFISGQNFFGTTNVSFNGTPASFTVDSFGGSLTAIVPVGATSGFITVSNPAGTATSATPFTVLQSPPTITSFTPASFTDGASVVITGTDFANVQSVTFAGVSAASFVVDSPTQITAVVPGGPLADGQIIVTTPGGVAGSPTSFTYFAPIPVPTITSFSPSSVTDGTVVVITGTGLSDASNVNFNGTSAASFTVDSATQITVVTPVGPLTNGPITVTTPGGTATSSTLFSYSLPIPTIGNFSPTAIASGTAVVISGTNFGTVLGVQFNGINASFTQNSPNQVTATAPTPLNPGLITLYTSNGSATSATPYTISTAPTITAITPSFGPEKRIITVTGTNFGAVGSPTPTVRVNGTPIGAFSRGTTTMTFAVPDGATTGPITLQTAQGLATSPFPFTVTTGPAPANDNFANAQIIAGISGVLNGNTANATKEPGEPNHANNPGGSSVWFTWMAPQSGLFIFNPSNSASSQFGIIQTIYTGNDLTSLTPVASGLTPTNVFARFGSAAVLNAVAGTTYRIALDGYNGVMADYRLSWSPLVAPTIASFTPSTATAGQTINININGSNFAPGASVSFGGGLVDSSRLNYQSATLITVTQVPLTAVTGPITVTTQAGSATSAATFTVIPPPAPTITSFTPNGAKTGTVVTLTGTNFTGTTAVRFNGVAVTAFTVNSATQITTTVPAGATTGFISVTTPGGTATSTTEFTVITPPIITQQPLAQTVTVGQPVSFSVIATSNGPLEYSWHKIDGSLVDNPTRFNPTLVIPSATLADAGTYYCQVGNNAAILETTTATLTVNKVPVAITLGNLITTYDGSPKAVTVTTNPANVPVQIIYHGIIGLPASAGNYLVAAFVDDATYTGSTSGTLVINKANANLTLTTPLATYNGAPHVATATTVPAGLAVSISYSSGTAPINVGSYTVNAAINDTNYTGFATGGFSIAPAVVTFAVSNTAQTYDGTAKSPTVVTTPVGVATVTTYNGSPTAPINAGNYPFAVNVTDPNYTGVTVGALAIARATATVALGNLSVTYDGAPHAPLATTTPAGLAVSFAYVGSATAPTNAAFYPVTATITDPNYTGSASATLAINKAPGTIALSGLAQTYDGTPKSVTTTTTPAGLMTVVLYNGSTQAPTAAGSYPISVTLVEDNYVGSTTGTLLIAQGTATIALGNLVQPYDGLPHSVTTTTTPDNLPVTVTYNGSSTAPTNPGSYAVVATITDANQTGTTSDTLVVTIPALVRHAPNLNGGLDGSLQVLLPESVTLNGTAYVSGDLLVPGTPAVQLNGHPTFVGTRDGSGAVAPSNYQVTLNGNALLRYLVRRTDAIALPAVATPPLPIGTRDVALNSAEQSPGDFATLRHLTLNSNAGQLALPAGTYGNVTVNGNSGLILGVAGATTAAVYHLQNLTLNGNSQLQIAGPVVLTLANGTSINANVGSRAHPEWLTLNVASGGVTLNSNVTFHGSIVAPNGTVTINGNSTLNGSVASDRLTINGNGLLDGMR